MVVRDIGNPIRGYPEFQVAKAVKIKTLQKRSGAFGSASTFELGSAGADMHKYDQSLIARQICEHHPRGDADGG